MSESRGLTLRKKKTHKRPVISAPQQQRPGAVSAPTNASLKPPKERPGQSETSDLVKRRYSTRYNQLPQFGNDVPDVPSLPGAGNLKRRSAGTSPTRPQSAHSAHPLKIDQAALADPNLQHERYVTSLLSNASEADIQEYQQNLRRVKNRNEMDLQQSVFQNRTQFIKISKEAERLKSEMTMLRGLMADLTTTLETGNTSNTTNELDTGLKRRNANRSSVANLEAMWNTQLQALWKNVEKSQKFLPAVPGRHVVMENGQWIELDSATWKPKRPVHVVLLNDHLLVASKKRKKLDPNVPQTGPAPTKLVAEECWPLGEIDVIDMAANRGQLSPQEEKAVATAITIRSGNKTWTYRHEKRDAQVKNDILTNIRKTQDELRKANLPKNDQRNSRSELNYFASRDPSLAKNADIMDGINSSKEKPEILIEVDGRQQNFRWIEGQIDELDIDIALQHAQVGVEKVEKLRQIAKDLKNNSIAQELISLKVDERAARLATILCRELVETPAFVEATKRTTGYLIRLGFEDRARTAFLSARSDTLTKRQRQCVFDGDLHKYIFSISYVYFTIIKNTVLIFQASFPSTTMSACIKWANEHLEVFNALLVRQLSAVEKRGKVWRDCMDVVWSHEREMFGEVGLDFREVIGRGLEYHKEASADGTRSRGQSRSKSRTRAA
ncbi:exocyst complex component exo84 [Neophaeococcomyces mojaviensis]|uniref:Exocyst complex component exo84 n=1 Tax=Neophaeococcomyces mojaviensis TaxID=3383035 RepID=A0ACC3A8K9_9EURO|nr:exocyst complex component exo84 [Knufia sp. JES_112]